MAHKYLHEMLPVFKFRKQRKGVWKLCIRNYFDKKFGLFEIRGLHHTLCLNQRRIKKGADKVIFNNSK